MMHMTDNISTFSEEVRTQLQATLVDLTKGSGKPTR
jgi:hypothetical protein